MIVSDGQAAFFVVACAMMALDVISGFLAACANKEVDSSAMRRGIYHKVLEVVLLFACLVIEVASATYIELPVDVPAYEVVAGYIIVMELTSILENVGKGNPAFADSPVFKLFKKEDDAK